MKCTACAQAMLRVLHCCLSVKGEGAMHTFVFKPQLPGSSGGRHSSVAFQTKKNRSVLVACLLSEGRVTACCSQPAPTQRTVYRGQGKLRFHAATAFVSVCISSKASAGTKKGANARNFLCFLFAHTAINLPQKCIVAPRAPAPLPLLTSATTSELRAQSSE